MDKDLKKHVGAIRITDNVGLLPRKMWNVFLLNAYDNLLTKQTHSINYSVLCEIVACNTKNSKHLEEALVKLCSVAIQWDVGGGCQQGGSWVSNMSVSSMLASAEIKDGVVHYEFSSLLSKMLYQPEMYQKISIAQQRLFKASYSLALWENCIRFVGVGRTGFEEVDLWRNLTGAVQKSYEVFKVFNQKVLQPAIKEINTVSSIEIELLTKKTGRKVTKIGFLVTQKKQIQLAIPEVISEIKLSKEYEDLIDIGIQHIQAIAWLQEYDIKYIRGQIDFVKEEQAKGKIKSSVAGFLISAIKGQYKNEKQLFKEKQEQLRLKRLEEERIKKKDEIISKAGIDFSKIEKQKFLQSLTDEQKENLLHEVLEEVSLDGYAVNLIKKRGLESASASLPIINRISDFSIRKREYVSKKLKESGF